MVSPRDSLNKFSSLVRVPFLLFSSSMLTFTLELPLLKSTSSSLYLCHVAILIDLPPEALKELGISAKITVIVVGKRHHVRFVSIPHSSVPSDYLHLDSLRQTNETQIKAVTAPLELS